jgi:hypothetical protein
MTWFLFLALACNPKPASTPASTDASAMVDVKEAQPTVDVLRKKLMARHEEDLPSTAEVAQFDDAETALQALAAPVEQVLVRRRALGFAAMYPTSTPFLLAVVDNLEETADVRAAALRGLSTHGDRSQYIVRGRAAAMDADPRVALAGVAILAGIEDSEQTLQKLSEAESTHPRVKEAAAKVLVPAAPETAPAEP